MNNISALCTSHQFIIYVEEDELGKKFNFNNSSYTDGP